MKVITEGPGWTMQVVCTGYGNGNGGCKSTLEINRDDLFMTERFDYGGGHDTFVTIECPVCKILTDLKEVDVPSKYRDKDFLPKGSPSKRALAQQNNDK